MNLLFILRLHLVLAICGFISGTLAISHDTPAGQIVLHLIGVCCHPVLAFVFNDEKWRFNYGHKTVIATLLLWPLMSSILALALGWVTTTNEIAFLSVVIILTPIATSLHMWEYRTHSVGGPVDIICVCFVAVFILILNIMSILLLCIAGNWDFVHGDCLMWSILVAFLMLIAYSPLISMALKTNCTHLILGAGIAPPLFDLIMPLYGLSLVHANEPAYSFVVGYASLGIVGVGIRMLMSWFLYCDWYRSRDV